jgi:uncharacterized membrane protein
MDQEQSSLNPLPPAQIERNRKFILTSYYGLCAYFLINSYMYFNKLSLITFIVWLIQIAPLLIFAAGLHKIKIRTYGWLCFVCLMYFTHGVLVAFDPARRILGIVEVLLCISMFYFLILFIRQYKNHYQVNI